MQHPKFSRRAFIQSLLTSLVLAGCGSDDSGQAGIPTASVIDLQGQPVPTNTPIPAPPDVVVQQFLDAWAQGNYDLMYDLASVDSRNRTPYHTFFAQYQNARTQSTATEIRTQVQSLLVEDAQATATYNSQWVTALFDTIDASHLMQLRLENGQWRVAWEPTLILPQLGTGVSLVLFDERPKRGIIFDSADQAVASHKQLVTIGVVPGQVTDEAQLITHLTAITNLTADDIHEKMISAQPDWFVPLVSIDFDDSVQHHDTLLALPGVQRQARPVRSYPAGDTAAHILGTMGAYRPGSFLHIRRRGIMAMRLLA